MDQTLLSEIIISENRQRRNFDADALWELAQSIDTKGLMHPIVVRITMEGMGDVPVLVSGERRMRACKMLIKLGKQIKCGGFRLKEGYVPTIPICRLEEDEYIEAELEENTHRVDLTWQEKLSAEQTLHELRCRQNPDHSFNDTALELKGNISDARKRDVGHGLRKDSKLADAMRKDPNIAKAKTKKEASKLLARASTNDLNLELANLANSSNIPMQQKHINILGDAIEVMKDMDCESFEVICTDPPYGIEANKFGDQSDRGHEYADSKDYLEELMVNFAKESYRVATKQAHMYVFFDLRHYQFFVDEFSHAGWYVWHAPIIWNKGNGMLPRPEHAPRRTYESILYCIKGNMSVTKVAPDVITIPPEPNLKHGAQKPVAVYTELLGRSAHPGFRVLDAFAGSGTIFPAANKLALEATAINCDPNDHALALTRINEE